jgi:SynChlorMet cassette radical SAM/SPASM protein ScmE
MRLIKTPESVTIDITNKCNLRCKHCAFFSSAAEVDNDLPMEEWLKFFKELNKYAIKEVTFCGGEPFYRKDILELVDGVVRNRMRFSILTNGTLVNDDIVKSIAKTGRCNYVQVSIDGFLPRTHDYLRGEGSFEKAIRGIKCLQKFAVPLHVRVTVFKKNVDELENIARFLLEEINISSFSTNSAGYLGLCRKNSEMLQLTADEQSRAMEILIKLEKEYPGRITAAAGPLCDAKMWTQMEWARRDGKESLPRRGSLTGCNCSWKMISVRADGMIVPCNLLSHIELGRINQDDLKDIWQNHPELKRLRERGNIPLSEFEFCKGCEYINYCTGGCPGTAHSISADAYLPSADACLRTFLKQGGKLPDEKFF